MQNGKLIQIEKLLLKYLFDRVRMRIKHKKFSETIIQTSDIWSVSFLEFYALKITKMSSGNFRGEGVFRDIFSGILFWFPRKGVYGNKGYCGKTPDGV